MKKITLLLTFLLAIASLGWADSSVRVRKTLNWHQSPVIHNPTGLFPTEIQAFDGATYSPEHPTLPYVSDRFPVESMGEVEATIVDVIYESFDKSTTADDAYLSSNLTIQTHVYRDRNQYYMYYYFIPIRQVAPGQYERVVSFEMKLDFNSRPVVARPRNDYTYNSVLETGNIYKIAVTGTGVHKLDYNFLKDELNIDIDNVDPRTIKMYGHPGGVLPENIDDFRYDDLKEMAIVVNGEGDGNFNTGDYILFYGEGPDKWFYDADQQYYTRPKNVYSNKHFYFIKVGGDNGLRPSSANSLSSTAYTTSTYDAFQRFEEDLFNLLNEAGSAQGSGQDWYGDIFNPTRERDYTLSFSDLILEDSAKITLEFAGRGKTSSILNASIFGRAITNSISSVNVANAESLYARIVKISEKLPINSNDLVVSLAYPAVGDGTNIGWLDYIEINARRQLKKVNAQLRFRDQRTLAYPTTTFQVSGADGNIRLWDVTDPMVPVAQDYNINGSTLSFGAETNEDLREFVVFEPNGNLLTAEAIGRVNNQNYHAIDDVDMLIVYHRDFETAAERLADHRRDFNNMNVATARIDLIYNEFSSGRPDPTAIRDFAKMLFDRNSDRFQYLLLIGDGSFDHRNITNQGNNFIPVYETHNSLDPVRAFPSDDYYTLLTEGEGGDLKGALDIAVGRIPIRTAANANTIINKIIRYDTSPEALGDWRNRVTFNADDEDGNIHLNQADNIANKLSNRHPIFNINKIYFDAYQQVSTAGGERFPKATEALNRDMFKGVLVVNYMGHGGARGWAQERVLTNSDISSWENEYALPLFVTATCSFAGYDEPSIVTAGEKAFVKETGGVIGLFTTVRAVYSFQNDRLTNAVFDTIFQEVNQDVLPIGEILRRAKNSNAADTMDVNSRKFTLLGDPTLQLAIPKHNVVTTKINTTEVSSGAIDTIQALDRVTITGEIQDRNGTLLSDFNGRVYPTIYDKEIIVSTLAQDPESSVKDFKIQRSALFKGQASVTDGKFEFTFVVPKDINYEYGNGKISYYAENGTTDARGFFEGFVIGGTNPEGINDDQGPLVEVFMNSEDFVFGGLTSPNPTLLAKLSDDNGINVVGNSIGHDLTGVLDQNTQNTYILNDFYESELDDYTKGEVRFPLFELEEGVHRITVKAWDVANNSGEGSTEFLVASDAEIALDYVLNYPNPFTTNTNFQFEHNLQNQNLDVQIQIFTVSGRLVKTIEQQVYTDGRRVSGINWDGTDDYGDRLGKGVYLYQVKLRAEDQRKTESDYEKLVILK